MRVGSIALGVVAIAIGAVWIGQGLNLIPGSSMTGVKMWFWIGLVVAIAGLALLVSGLRRRDLSRRH